MNFTSTWSLRVLYYHMDPFRSQLLAGFQNKWININSSMVNWLSLFFSDLLISRAWIEFISWRIFKLCFSRMCSFFAILHVFCDERIYTVRSLKIYNINSPSVEFESMQGIYAGNGVYLIDSIIIVIRPMIKSEAGRPKAWTALIHCNWWLVQRIKYAPN